ncbi:MAG: hypothetical protein PHS14_16925 [Elusimicrobia bacterium]|nr:hypothetical protein [Elusimicrobiota bacterium]
MADRPAAKVRRPGERPVLDALIAAGVTLLAILSWGAVLALYAH